LSGWPCRKLKKQWDGGTRGENHEPRRVARPVWGGNVAIKGKVRGSSSWQQVKERKLHADLNGQKKITATPGEPPEHKKQRHLGGKNLKKKDVVKNPTNQQDT